MFYHSLKTVAHKEGHKQNERKFEGGLVGIEQNFSGHVSVFEASANHILAQMQNKNQDIRYKLDHKLAVWEAEMQALLCDFDHNLEQIAEIEHFNSQKIDKISKSLRNDHSEQN